jgi:hypothetical protein
MKFHFDDALQSGERGKNPGKVKRFHFAAKVSYNRDLNSKSQFIIQTWF